MEASFRSVVHHVRRKNKYEKTFCSFTYGTLFQVSGNTYQYETLSVYYTLMVDVEGDFSAC